MHGTNRAIGLLHPTAANRPAVAGGLSPPIPCVRELLRHHPDLLRQREPASRARVHDHCGRRGEPSHAAAGRGRLLPHRHRRARVEGRAKRGCGGSLTEGVLRPGVGRVPAAHGRSSRHQRLLHPHLRRGTRDASCRPSSSACVPRATCTRTPTPACTARRARPSTPMTISSTACARSTARRRSGSRRSNWFFRLSAYEDRLRTLYDEQPRVRAAARPVQRGAGLHRGRPEGHLAVPRLDRVGRARAVGARSGRSTSGSTR